MGFSASRFQAVCLVWVNAAGLAVTVQLQKSSPLLQKTPVDSLPINKALKATKAATPTTTHSTPSLSPRSKSAQTSSGIPSTDVTRATLVERAPFSGRAVSAGRFLRPCLLPRPLRESEHPLREGWVVFGAAEYSEFPTARSGLSFPQRSFLPSPPLGPAPALASPNVGVFPSVQSGREGRLEIRELIASVGNGQGPQLSRDGGLGACFFFLPPSVFLLLLLLLVKCVEGVQGGSFLALRKCIAQGRAQAFGGKRAPIDLRRRWKPRNDD